jgi:hypothetical protein
MPTPKQVRYHYKRIYNLRYRLSVALNDAHHADVIQYTDYQTQSPCKSLSEMWERFKDSTKNTLWQAMREEIEGSK